MTQSNLNKAYGSLCDIRASYEFSTGFDDSISDKFDDDGFGYPEMIELLKSVKSYLKFPMTNTPAENVLTVLTCSTTAHNEAKILDQPPRTKGCHNHLVRIFKINHRPAICFDSTGHFLTKFFEERKKYDGDRDPFARNSNSSIIIVGTRQRYVFKFYGPAPF